MKCEWEPPGDAGWFLRHRKTPTLHCSAYERWKPAVALCTADRIVVGQRPTWSRAAKQEDPMIPPVGYPKIKAASLRLSRYFLLDRTKQPFSVAPSARQR
jgi:hypothetical protein